MRATPRWLLVAILGICTALLYLVPAPYFNNLNNPNENVRVYMTRAIVDHQTFAINEIVDEWGYVNDKAAYNGKLYPGKGPGMSFVGVPVYWFHRTLSAAIDHAPTKREIVWCLRLGAAIVPFLFFLLKFARDTRRLSSDLGVRSTTYFAAAFASCMWPYAMLFASHSVMAACLFASYLMVFDHVDEPNARWPLLGIGFLLVLGVSLEYPAALGGAVVYLYGFYKSADRGRYLGWTVAGGLLPGLLMLFFHWRAFGNPLATPYAWLDNPEFQAQVSGGFYGLKSVKATALWGSFFAPSNGLFWFMPWSLPVVLALPVGLFFRRTRELAAVTLLVLLAYTVFISMVQNWRGGWTAGPRYIVAVCPFLCWYFGQLLALAQERGAQWGTQLLFWPLLAVATFACGLSAAWFPHYPEVVMNPVFEIGVYFAARGFVPHTMLPLLGLEWVPLAAVLVGSVAAMFVAITLCTSRLALAERIALWPWTVGVALAMLWSASQLDLEDRAGLERSRDFVLTVWEPRASALDEEIGRTSLPWRYRQFDVTAAELESAAGACARRGHSACAAELYGDAWQVRARSQRPLRSHPRQAVPAGAAQGSGDTAEP